MAKASSSQPPKLKSSKKSSKEKAPQAISPPEEVPSDVDSDNLDEPMNENGSSSSSSSSDSEVDSEENLEDATPRKSTKVVSATAEKRGKSLRKYEPPIGMTELKVSSAFTSSPFEWDNLASKPGVELWAIRVPKDLKPSRLSSLQLSLPSPSSSHSQITGSLKTKTHSYTLSTAGTNIHTKAQINEEGRQPTAGPGAIDSMIMDVDEGVPGEMKVEGGEEMDGLRLLVPKVKEGGKLFVAPKPITRKLILTPTLSPPSTSTSTDEPPLPSFLSNPTSAPAITQESPATQTKRAQPTHLLKFRNQAYGFTTPGPEHTVVKGMDVDGAQEDDDGVQVKGGSSSQVDGEKKDKEKKDKKEKKRKNENGDSPKKKSKKSKD